MNSVYLEESFNLYFKILSEEIEKIKLNFPKDTVEKAVDIILDCEGKGNRVHVTGIGKPAYVAGYIASLLSSTGTPSYELHGTEAIHGSSGQVLPGDVVIAISNSGETKELKATVETLMRNGARIISVTGNKDSWLAQKGEISLIASVSKEGDNMNKAPRISILSEIIILQCLSILLQNEKHLDVSQYVKWHPGGSLGAAIRKEGY